MRPFSFLRTGRSLALVAVSWLVMASLAAEPEAPAHSDEAKEPPVATKPGSPPEQAPAGTKAPVEEKKREKEHGGEPAATPAKEETVHPTGPSAKPEHPSKAEPSGKAEIASKTEKTAGTGDHAAGADPAEAKVVDQKGTFWDGITNNFIAASLPGTPRAKATNEPPSDLALQKSSDLITNTNVRLPTAEEGEKEALEALKRQLEAARKAREANRFEEAARGLIGIMDAEAPVELKRTALLELALTAQQDSQLVRAQQIFSQYTRLYPDDASIPEVLLRQGLIYRQMGAPTLALTKFYSVMTLALNFKADHLDYYQKLVLLAQTEIADTYYLQGRYEESSEFFQRLLRLDARELSKPAIHYKLVRCLSSLNRDTDLVASAQDFLTRYPAAVEQPEVRFLLATSLKRLGRNRDALEQVLLLLQSQQATARKNPENWYYWQQRTGNEIANQLFREGDYANALEVYLNLAGISPAAAWQAPVQYQIGLVYERLGAPPKALAAFQKVIGFETEILTNGTPSLKAIVEMAKWRKDYLGWQSQADGARQDLLQPRASALPAGSAPK
ncbi:MAG TPA: tetratricopeptide repeat protein [Verrucomicrobiae bacterium]|nr:tetratricopeptide repeat protein [Verrucomicrobiae bacterium]